MNKKVIYNIGLGINILASLLLLGILKFIFGADVNTNLFQTGITPGLILGLSLALTSWWIYKKHL